MKENLLKYPKVLKGTARSQHVTPSQRHEQTLIQWRNATSFYNCELSFNVISFLLLAFIEKHQLWVLQYLWFINVVLSFAKDSTLMLLSLLLSIFVASLLWPWRKEIPTTFNRHFLAWSHHVASRWTEVPRRSLKIDSDTTRGSDLKATAVSVTKYLVSFFLPESTFWKRENLDWVFHSIWNRRSFAVIWLQMTKTKGSFKLLRF